MADIKQAWKDATRKILSALDLPNTYRELGLDVCGSKPSAKGWVEARAFGVEDRTPSAGINIGDNPMQGRYKNFRDGLSMTLFDFAAGPAGRFGGDWREARKHYARQTGVELPNGADEVVADRFEFSDVTPGVLMLYANGQGREGIGIRAMQEAGARAATWPKKLSAEKTNHLISFPMYGSALLDLEPIGWHSVAQNPRLKIRQFQGKGHEDKLLPKMSVGEVGLMNVDGLRRLAEAEVVNVVEGLTDMLAVQTILGPWRDVDPDGRKHVVITAGACSAHPKPEWMQHFAGKEVRICFDVGDKDNAGQVGAAVWVAACLPVALSVRNVQLPLGKDDGKNDLRAWITETPGAFRNYADMDEYARQSPVIEAGDTEVSLEAHEAILKSLGLTVIGEHEGQNRIEVFSEHAKKSATIADVDKLTIPKLIQLVGPEPVEEYIHDGREPQPGKYQVRDVQKAIAAAAHDKTYYSTEKFGAGVWAIGEDVLLVKAGEAAVFNGDGQVHRKDVPFHEGRVLDIGRGSGDWIDFDKLNAYLEQAKDLQWCAAVVEETRALFAQWTWKEGDAVPLVLTSLVINSWLQTLWDWRPEVFIVGGTSTGKTIFTQQTLAEGIFRNMALFCQKPTEAAITQHMRHHAKVCIIDEFEKDAHRQKIMELFRASSRGGEKLRGTADQKGASYRLKHLPWFSAINTGLRWQADKNRYIIINTERAPREVYSQLRVPSPNALADLGIRLLAVGLAHYHEARRLIQSLTNLSVEGIDGRIIESYALPCGMLAAIAGMSEADAGKFMAGILDKWNFDLQSERDDESLLSDILSASVFTSGGRRATVTQLLSENPDPDNISALNRVGVKRITKRKGKLRGKDVLWVFAQNVKTELLFKSDYDKQSIEEHLLRLNGADRSPQRLGGQDMFQGIEIPMITVDAIFQAGGQGADSIAEEFSESP